MLGRGQLGSCVVLELTEKTPCFLLAKPRRRAWFPSMGVAFDIPLRRCMYILLIAVVFGGIRLECCHVIFETRRGGIRRASGAQHQLFWLKILDVLPRPQHTVHAYLIRSRTFQYILGQISGIRGVSMVVLMACWSQKYQIFGQNMVKTLQNKALGKSGNTCLLRRFEASPTHLISFINVMLLYVLIDVCR
jgi:hypothetical protein